MPDSFFWLALALLAADAALRPWKPAEAAAKQNAVYLGVAWVPLFLVPFLPPLGVTLLASAVALFALYSFARMVGLTQHLRFFVPAFAATAAFFAVAHARWYGLFQAMPVFAVTLVVAAAGARKDAKHFLQLLCLAWVGLLVYGYLFGHAVLLADLHRFQGGRNLLAMTILFAKFGDVGWVALKRVAPGRDWLQLVATPLGALLGGALGALLGWRWAEIYLPMSLLAGLGLAFGARAHDLLVADVADVAGARASESSLLGRPLKGTMLFGFAFAVALAWHWLRYKS